MSKRDIDIFSSARLFAVLLVAVVVFAACVVAVPDAHAATATKVAGVKTEYDAGYAGNKLVNKITVSPAYGRNVKLYRYDLASKSYVLERTYRTANKRKATVKIVFPSSWKTFAKSTWRITVPSVKKVVKQQKTKVDTGKVNKKTGKPVTKTVVKKIVVRPAFAKKSVKVKVRCDFLTCDAGIVMDADTGKVVYSDNPFLEHRIASLTKMMTATLLVENKKPTSRIKFTSSAVNTPYAYGFAYGEKLAAKDAVYAMMLPSSNDTATAVGIAVGGSTSKFCKMMNKRAKKLGCRATVYKNAHGLDRYGAHSTVYDQALIGSNIMNDPNLSLVRKAARTRVKTITSSYGNSYRLYNKNKLLGTKWNAIGLKTGTEDDAGYCLCGAFEIKGKTYVTVVLGAYSDYGRYKNTKRLVKFTKYAVKHKLPEYDL